MCKHPEDEQFCRGEGGIWPWSSPVPREVHEEFAMGFAAPMLGGVQRLLLVVTGDWSLSEATVSCHVTSQRFLGCLGAAQNVQLVPPWHDPHIPWVSHWETLSSLYNIQTVTK